MRSEVPLSRREQLLAAFQEECLTVAQCALVVQVSQKTIRRRLPQLPATDIARNGRILRIRRSALLALFGLR